jgi:hypothetical protein
LAADGRQAKEELPQRDKTGKKALIPRKFAQPANFFVIAFPVAASVTVLAIAPVATAWQVRNPTARRHFFGIIGFLPVLSL